MADRIIFINCIDCNKSVQKTSSNQSRCVECSKENKKQRMIEWRAKNQDKITVSREKDKARRRNATKLRPRKTYGHVHCVNCGCLFEKKYARTIICSENCKKQRNSAAKRKNAPREYKERNCIACGVSYKPKSSRQVRCTECQKRKLATQINEWRKRNVKHLQQYERDRKFRNPEYVKQRYWKNPEHYREKSRKHQAKNGHKRAEYARNRFAKLRKIPRFRLEHSIRNSIRKELARRHVTKSKRSMEFVGLTASELLLHLLQHPNNSDGRFTEENYGKCWHIDHIRPLASFSDDELHLAWHYKNLQPLDPVDNIRKSAIWNGMRCKRSLLTSHANK